MDSRFEGKNLLYFCRSQAIPTNDLPTSAIAGINFDSVIDGGTTLFFLMSSTSSIRYLGTDGGYGVLKDLSVSADRLILNQNTGNINNVNNRRLNNLANSSVPDVGIAFGNYFSKVKIEDCVGNIYIRGFAVNGGTGVAGSLNHVTEHGFEVKNSSIVLENVLSCRCFKSGFLFENSKVIITRGIVAFRNYALLGSVARNANIESAGIRAYNSQIQLRAIKKRNWKLIRANICTNFL
jgi:hypothetical protein